MQNCGIHLPFSVVVLLRRMNRRIADFIMFFMSHNLLSRKKLRQLCVVNRSVLEVEKIKVEIRKIIVVLIFLCLFAKLLE